MLRALLRVLVKAVLCTTLPASLAAVGCAKTDGDGSSDDQAITSGTCEVFSAAAKRKLTADELAQLKDPIAQKLLLGEGCPTNFDEISSKLVKTDADGCPTGGVSTRLVNDSAFLTGNAEGAYRGVLTRDCGGRAPTDLFVSVFGISPDA